MAEIAFTRDECEIVCRKIHLYLHEALAHEFEKPTQFGR